MFIQPLKIFNWNLARKIIQEQQKWVFWDRIVPTIE
jgi:hypothetical protein